MQRGAVITLTIFVAMAWSSLAWAQTLLELAGSSYRGPVTVEAVSQQDGAIRHHANGEATITLSRGDEGQLLLAGEATIEGQVAMRFDHSLTRQGDGSWLDDGDDTRVEISMEGEIGILAQSKGSTITAGGRVDTLHLQLHLRTSGHAVEPDLVFAFDLVRRADARPDRTGKCGQVIWQNRFIADPFGGGMSSVMVPVCVPTP